ncbi:MAG TPA: DUF1587 domain-containing protein, partial [Polyangiales bacterium]|nr:DUF1587 domain-containing protein [Polyangiales bacterium]
MSMVRSAHRLPALIRAAVLGWLACGVGCAGEAGEAPVWMPEAGSAAAPPITEPAPSDEPLIPVRVRRLSNGEYDGTVAALLGTELAPGRGFAPDKRQAGFTANEAQRVDSVLAGQLFAAAEQLAA